MYAVIFKVLIATGSLHSATITGPMTAEQCHIYVTAPSTMGNPKYREAGECVTKETAADAMTQNLCARTGTVLRLNGALVGAINTYWSCE